MYFPSWNDSLKSFLIHHYAREFSLSLTFMHQFDFESRTAKRFRQEIRSMLGFREACDDDSEGFINWFMIDILPHMPKEDQFPNSLNMQLDLSEEAKRYFEYGDTFLEKIFPYWIASNIDRLKILLIPLLTLLFPLFKGVFPFVLSDIVRLILLIAFPVLALGLVY